MSNAIGPNGIAQGPGNMFLPDDVAKALWTPFARYN
jgi:hypothetical protein